MNNNTGKTLMEKHIGVIFQGITTAVIIGCASLLFSLNTQMSLVQYQLKQITDTQSQYVTKDTIDQRAKLRDMEIQQLTGRVVVLEQRGKK